MPGTNQPLEGMQAFWSQIQALSTRISSLETWVRAGNARAARGQATLTFSASALSSATTITHGLANTPGAVVGTQLGTGGASPVVIQCTGVTSTQAMFLGEFVSGTYTGTINFAWIATL